MGSIDAASVQGSDECAGPKGASDDAHEPLSARDAFDILSNDRRRFALHYLMQEEEAPSLNQLSRHVAAWENDVPPEAVTSTQRRRVHVALHQTHLPRMDDAGIVTYESSADPICLAERADDLNVYMEVVPGNDITWSTFYLGLSLFSLSLVAAVAVGAYPFSVLSMTQAAVFSSLLFVVASAVHVRWTRRRRLGSQGEPPTRRV
ncbi:hypothetical protein SAMN04487947_1901 [Halogeometricum rufum]|uniref:DUF7344 domain-containing protein n=1 Tax=Halogeometricum rufum TaxID=553469 RepID=A0A1I6H021_9EURY|nr:hypothetical protein [Halogeometricum rufum]SFR47806.1 hypothetical protein SAMN04487947_1901 [Halogeometricum rufum]